MVNSLISTRLSAVGTVLATVLFLFLAASGEVLRSTPDMRNIGRGSNNGGREKNVMIFKETATAAAATAADLPVDVYASGSSLPDCSHACGLCFPCRRVTVSFKCSAAESCPIVYRCMCRGKFYQVPSN